MRIETLIEDITLVAEAGDAEDALDLSRQLIRKGNTKRAIDVRRTVVRGVLDRAALRKLAVTVAEDAAKHQRWVQAEWSSLAREARTLNLPAQLTTAIGQIARTA
ncbi:MULTISPECIES: hypothetical protein [unclassified Streptomyces]|uniref:hypothetical protein n=1 Tax=unclassified Streptomyces TaxID=2593676 RepID=UPI002E110582|nr:hypothetical protein OIE76_07345 [Streptomyces sp. NBC_01727]